MQAERKRAIRSTSSGNISPVSASSTRPSRPRTQVTGSALPGLGSTFSTSGVFHPDGKVYPFAAM